MDKNAIKKYAIWAREELIKRVSTKAEEYGISKDNMIDENADSIGDRVLTATEKSQRKNLIEKIKEKGYEQVVEEVAYTWFNRFIALRFMEVNGYLPTRVRVFTDGENNFKPQILEEAIHLELDGLKKDVVFELKEKNENEALYKYLLITQCNALSSILPKMFPKIGDFTILLFPDNVLREGSVIEQLIAIIPEEDFKEAVEIIGWLYQYYNEERKNEVINIYKGTVAKNDVPAATQLFTTDWVVRYMVDNSLGKYWIERNPSSKLAEKLQYFTTPKNGEINYINEKVTPEEMTFFDPCMGSGHILVYAFDVLLEIYIESGYTERDAVASIIENNLFGLDIDTRAYQLAYFALMMKARSKDRRFLTRDLSPQVYCPQDSDELENFGSIFIVGNLGTQPTEPQQLTLDNMGWKKDQNNWNFKRLLTQKYAVVCTNPPYLNKFNPTLKKYVTDNYKDYSGDLFSVFIYKNFDYCKPNGYSAFMTPFVWMFIKTYEKLREYIINSKSITSLIQMEYSAFEEATVPICSFILKNGKESEKGLYFKLSDFKGGMEAQKQKVLEALANKECGYFYETSIKNFTIITNSPISFWGTASEIAAFNNGIQLSDIGETRQGMASSDDARFVRVWHEVFLPKVCFTANNSLEAMQSSLKWFPYNKGGSYRKWYGNNTYLINYELDGKDVKEYAKKLYKSASRTIKSQDVYFKAGGTWSAISSGSLAVRWFDNGFVISNAGMALYADNKKELLFLIAILNSHVVSKSLIKLLNESLNFNAGDISRIPIIIDNSSQVLPLVDKNVRISKTDWDSFETSWDFERHPFIQTQRYAINNHSDENAGVKTLISECYGSHALKSAIRFENLRKNEEELNRIFIDIYGLQDELTPDVEDKDVTVRLADKTRDIKSFISYAVGCMFGRYSLDVDGLAYAGGEFDNSKYASYIPDTDNIIPICDDEYFEDDIVGRFIKFVEVVYGTATLEENLEFIASALGTKGTAREVIRNYFLNGFFADHCKIYQKRPIYWLFDSGKKNGFKALVYMHRYAPDTIARMRTDYVHEQQGRYRTALSDLERRIESATTSERVKLTKGLAQLKDQAEEIRVYEEKIHHLADQMISIDLDDGVKNNYTIFGDVLAKIK